jgi:hypothetical protein
VHKSSDSSRRGSGDKRQRDAQDERQRELKVGRQNGDTQKARQKRRQRVGETEKVRPAERYTERR